MTIVWIATAAGVGAIGLLVVVRVQDRSGHVPSTSMFAAAGIVMSLIALVTVALAARQAGAPLRAAIALGGAFAAIALAKFAMGPTALFQGNREAPIQNVGGLTSGGMVVVIAVVIGALYLAAIWLLAVLMRPTPPPDGPSMTMVVWLILFVVAAVIGTSIFVTTAAGQYLTFATTGLEAGGIALALFVAAGLVALAFRETSVRARKLGTVSMYLTVAWVAVAFLLVFQVLWVVFLLAVVAIWPFRSVTPK